MRWKLREKAGCGRVKNVRGGNGRRKVAGKNQHAKRYTVYFKTVNICPTRLQVRCGEGGYGKKREKNKVMERGMSEGEINGWR